MLGNLYSEDKEMEQGLYREPYSVEESNVTQSTRAGGAVKVL